MPRLGSVDCPHCGETQMYDDYWVRKREVLRIHFAVCKRMPWWRRKTRFYFFRLGEI